MLFFWVLSPCRIVGRCQRFEETYRLHLQGLSVSQKRWHLPTILYGTKTQDIIILTAMKT
jgi:hypothetical protein